MVHLGGSEKYVLALIHGLRAKKHDVFIHAIERGKSFELALTEGAKAYSKQQIDLIVLNHNSTFQFLSTRLKRSPVFQICHGKFPYLEQPISNLSGYFAVSPEVQNHLKRANIESTLLWNPVIHGGRCSELHRDIDFLVLSQGKKATEIIKSTLPSDFHCVFGNKHANEIDQVEALMNRSKVVVGTGRAIIEAAVHGCAPYGFDSRHYDGLKLIGPVSSVNWSSLAYSNYSGRGCQSEIDLNQLEQSLITTHQNWQNLSKEVRSLVFPRHTTATVTDHLLQTMKQCTKGLSWFRSHRILDIRNKEERQQWSKS